MPSRLHPVVKRFVQEAGSTTQSFGLGRVVGQIYAYLYFCAEPQHLGDLQEALGISKGSASTGVRQLEQWEAVRKVWVRGDRKDYWEASDWFGKILRKALFDTVAEKLNAYSDMLDRAAADAEQEAEETDAANDGEMTHILERVNRLQRFHNRARRAWENPIFQKLFR